MDRFLSLACPATRSGNSNWSGNCRKPPWKNSLEEVLTSAEVKEAAALIEKRLGRELKPFDIWYNGFKPRAKITEAELDRRVSQRYPDLKAFEKDMRAILQQLGFTPRSADFIAEPRRRRPGPRRRPCLGRLDALGKIAPAHPRPTPAA